MEDCRHGTRPEWCAICNGDDRATTSHSQGYGYHGVETKQDILNATCGELGIPRQRVGVGSSLPSEVFETAADRGGVPIRSMPAIGEAR